MTWRLVLHLMLVGASLTQGQAWARLQSENETRLSHAKELLGKYYERSAAAVDAELRELRDFVKGRIAAAFPHQPKRFRSKIYRTVLEESRRHGFDPIFLMAVIQNESSFKPAAKGKDGEIGLMQILPSTGRWIAESSGIPWKGKRTLQDPVLNIRIGATYLARLREKFEHGRLYLSAYNMGPTHVRRALAKDIWPKAYASRVMNRYLRYYRGFSRELAATQE